MLDFPTADVSIEKVVDLDKNKKFKVDDHDFSKVSFIPDATLVHSIQENDREEDGRNTKSSKDTDGKLCNGKCFLKLRQLRTVLQCDG